tara:strand:+ start:858 stop:1004 length:147 start_codon:yes stop_codon:yes gene_type:complete
MNKIIEAGKHIIEGWWSEEEQQNDFYKVDNLGAEFSVSHVLEKNREDI